MRNSGEAGPDRPDHIALIALASPWISTSCKWLTKIAPHDKRAGGAGCGLEVARPLADLAKAEPAVERDRRHVGFVDFQEQRSRRVGREVRAAQRPSAASQAFAAMARATAMVRISASPAASRASTKPTGPSLPLPVSRPAKPNTVSCASKARTRRRSTAARNPRDAAPRAPGAVAASGSSENSRGGRARRGCASAPLPAARDAPAAWRRGAQIERAAACSPRALFRREPAIDGDVCGRQLPGRTGSPARRPLRRSVVLRSRPALPTPSRASPRPCPTLPRPEHRRSFPSYRRPPR